MLRSAFRIRPFGNYRSIGGIARWGGERYEIGTVLRRGFAKKKKEEPIQTIGRPMKLIFDEKDRCLVFKHLNGENELKWMVRADFAFIAMNLFLFVSELTFPVFGGWNLASFTFGLGAGLAGALFLNVFSKRTIKEVRLFKAGDRIEVLFFNAFWKEKSAVFHVNELANLQPSRFSYMRTEHVNEGFYYINLEKNTFSGLPEYDEITRSVLNGHAILFSRMSAVADKYKKYR
eukprot:TRINITY_DN6490_c0_g1_i3.p1 TRINITY_DN6490_c0_g1~~TRINITY_DN6490_c0_g1_i3.p1  ORF type:complete len:232 (+),score=37.17 TRINITY_DN6490_c0_g1_i3:131-826(+)